MEINKCPSGLGILVRWAKQPAEESVASGTDCYNILVMHRCSRTSPVSTLLLTPSIINHHLINRDFVNFLHCQRFCLYFILFVKILPSNSPCHRRPAHDERRLRCRGGDGSASYHSPPQGALLWPGGWEQPRVPEGEKHGPWPATGL